MRGRQTRRSSRASPRLWPFHALRTLDSFLESVEHHRPVLRVFLAILRGERLRVVQVRLSQHDFSAVFCRSQLEGYDVVILGPIRHAGERTPVSKGQPLLGLECLNAALVFVGLALPV